MADASNKPELMAPAGDLACAFAAFDAGADAVYAGLGDFNARQRAANFSPEQLAALTAWARQHRRKVYITLNTLVKDTELFKLNETLGQIDNICPDAVIVQDLGVLHILRTYLPHLTVHASTQMGAHNSAGVDMLHRLGAQRVILERQITWEELNLIRQRTGVELEVFVHGALCCSLSGMCLFSSWMGGWSGNRGRCKQPCRRRFFTPEGNGFFFSTHDLYSLDDLHRLTDMGINAFKIEGRLRGPDYVSGAVTAYRRVLDATPEQRAACIKEARAVLSQTAGRKWSAGFRSPESTARVIAPDRPGGSGRLCGRVEKLAHNGFFIRPTRRIALGDTLRVQPPSAEAGPALEVTRLKSGQGHRVQSLRRSELGFVYCDKEVALQSRVYIIAEKAPDYTGRIAALAQVEKTLALSICLERTGVSISIVNSPQVLQWHKAIDISPAQTLAVSADKIGNEFSRIRHGAWRVAAVRIEIKGRLFLQEKLIRRLRQDFTQWLEAEGVFTAVHRESSGCLSLNMDLTSEGRITPRTDSAVHTVRGKKERAREAIRAVDLDQDLSQADEVILPSFCAESELQMLSQRLTQVLSRGFTRIRVTSLFQFALLQGLPRRSELTITAAFPLPACNRYAVYALKKLGAGKVMLWPEMDEQAVKSLVHRFGPEVEVFVAGRLPILMTRARVPVSGRITGGHGQVFHVETQGDLTCVYPDVQLAIPVPAGASTFHDRTGPAQGKTSDFNYTGHWA